MAEKFESGQIDQNEQSESVTKDISQDFLNMGVFDFLDYLRTLKKEPELSIIIDWKGKDTARRLKAFLESKPQGQKRSATIRATQEQHDQELNVFASGVKWEKVEE